MCNRKSTAVCRRSGGPLQLVKITHQGLTWINQPLIRSK